VLVATAVPILGLSLAILGRTGAAAREVTGLDAVRRATGGVDLGTPAPDVRLAPASPSRPAPAPLAFRNPFAFAPPSLPARPAPSPVLLAPPPDLPPAIPTSVALSLIGVATTNGADGRVERTAIITGPADAFYMVRDGDSVMTRYRVDAVLADSVRLLDSATGAPVSLTIR